MSSVPNRFNVKLARLFYKYDEPREKPVLKADKPFVKPENYEAYAPYNFSWFIEGKIAAMGCPRHEANLNYLVDAGIDHLITLSPERRPPIEGHGRGRTGTMLACYLVHCKDMAPERATFEQEKMVCHYHDCVRGTVSKPDYRLLDDKAYFDVSMKYTYGERETREAEDYEEGVGEEDDSSEEESEKLVKLKGRKKKTHAMVINHKIYF
ncbi:putative dual specificity phosphatase 23-like protein [Operophtera brumata]|uniref:Putative dual specificity phosphatase 23-like protein n=1 Tax=Operophtera brumata TaxID=104452 RepID=A0A0L7LVG1_OPEBR|nr:putative dual specificity phosphatase 23-like protein [Operophtera brumata]